MHRRRERRGKTGKTKELNLPIFLLLLLVALCFPRHQGLLEVRQDENSNEEKYVTAEIHGIINLENTAYDEEEINNSNNSD